MAQNGDVDGTGADARFSEPSALTTDTNGDLFVADSGNTTIREVTPASVVTQALPAGLAVGTQTLVRDSNGNFYLPERNAILKVSSSGLSRRLPAMSPGPAIEMALALRHYSMHLRASRSTAVATSMLPTPKI
jgi:hypothetical protein